MDNLGNCGLIMHNTSSAGNHCLAQLRTSGRGPLNANTSRIVSLSSGHSSTGGGGATVTAADEGSASARTTTALLLGLEGREQ